jgi:hypothetical protein
VRSDQVTPREWSESGLQIAGALLVVLGVWGLLPIFWAVLVTGAILLTAGVVLERERLVSRGTGTHVSGPLDYE